MSRLAAGPSGADESEYDVVQPRPFVRGAATGAVVGLPIGLVAVGLGATIMAIKGMLVGGMIR